MRKGDFLKTASYNKQEPGKYELKGFATDIYAGVPNCKFGQDSRVKNFKQNTPGPGRYDETRIIGTTGNPKYSMPGRRKDHVSIERQRFGVGAPGCDTYNPKDKTSKKNGPLFSVSKSRRDGSLAIFKNTPGAGTYQPDAATKIVRHNSASWSMGTNKRPVQQHFVPPTPGPGTYS